MIIIIIIIITAVSKSKYKTAVPSDVLKACGEVDVQLRSLLSMVLYWGGQFHPEKTDPGTYWTGRWGRTGG